MVETIYASRATGPMEEADLDELLRRARAKNQTLGVTGVLLYHEGSFLQVLEGPRRIVARLLAQIDEDPRHDRIRLLRHQEIAVRRFETWAMGFLRSVEGVAALGHRAEPGFVDFLRSGRVDHFIGEDGLRLKALMQGFRAGRYRST